MLEKPARQILWPWAVMVILYLAAIAFRPLLPIDETRYMTVAWEMYLRKAWLAPLTLNFEPYHHKPPMLFWLINLFWSIFGINRWAALIPVTLASTGVVFLTVRLGRKILPEGFFDPLRISLLMLGSVPFLVYSTLVMFDLMLAVFVLASLTCLLDYAESRGFRSILLMALFTGLGVLTKGPVAYLYIIFPMLLAPLWVSGFSRPASWYRDCLAGILLSLLPVCFWLVPVLAQSDNHFAFWLLWEQTAGRVTGNFADAHIRPLYFYLPLLPLLFAPWIFFPSFWRGIKNTMQGNTAIKFLLCWLAPVFLAFSLISGKQPHYLLPLLPGVILFLAIALQHLPLNTLKKTVVVMVGIIVIGQNAAYVTYFRYYDLRPVAQFVQSHPDIPWAFVRNYHGEIGYLARIEKPIADREMKDILKWFNEHPDGMAVIRYDDGDEIHAYKKHLSMPYRGKYLGVFSKE
jgi:4-amino-4-deoxy-L-arabinose transferase-like glycosyltransferase